MTMIMRKVFSTGSGWCCLWDRNAFHDVKNQGIWEDQFLDEEFLHKRIRNGDLVPINDFSDGGYDIEVKLGTRTSPEVLTEHEKRFIGRVSLPYRLHSNGVLCASGIEFVENPPGMNVVRLEIPPGEYTAVIQEIEHFEFRKGSGFVERKDASQFPGFIVLLNPAPENCVAFREDSRTFATDRPPPPGQISIRLVKPFEIRAMFACLQEFVQGGNDVRDALKRNDPIYLGNLFDLNGEQTLSNLLRAVRILETRGVDFEIILDDEAIPRDKLSENFAKREISCDAFSAMSRKVRYLAKDPVRKEEAIRIYQEEMALPEAEARIVIDSFLEALPRKE